MVRHFVFGRTVLTVALAITVLGFCGVASANPLYYVGSSIADLTAPASSSVAFNTDTGDVTLDGGATADGFSPVAPQSEDVNGVRVFRFRNVNISNNVAISVTGSKPIAIAASGDMYISSGFDVSGSVLGRAGGGLGGGGGGNGGGGTGGSGVVGGAGGGGGNGGSGGGILANGAAGSDGGSGAVGNSGAAGGNGVSGASGNAGDFGFGSGAGGPAGGNGGGGGGGGSGGGTGGGSGTASGNGGGGGGSGLGNGSVGGNGVAGGAGGIGGTGANGVSGSSGISGSDGVFDIPVDTLALYGGTSGGGGGGGGGGTGGGQGGSGGGGKGGGGGGGGGRGFIYALAAGGDGGHGGTSGLGGSGGIGGNGGVGGAGGNGGNGGGAVILSADGILDVASAMTMDISAGSRTLGVAGDGGAAGAAGAAGATGGAGSSGASGGCFIFCGGTGGKGGDGGSGGVGGSGGTGGGGGAGGNGGIGTPGMIKLHGSIIRAGSMQVMANGGADNGQTIYQGKVTLISNMNSAALDDNAPVPLGNLYQEGRTTDSAITDLSPFTADVLPRPSHPYVPQLTTGPAVQGLLQETANGEAVDYYNLALVNGTATESTLPPSQLTDSIKLKRLTGSDSLYDGFDQIFLINDSAEDFLNITVKVDTNPAVKINGDGLLSAGITWTTTVPTGAAVSLNQLPIITLQPTDKIRFPDDSVVFSVTAQSVTPACGVNANLCYQWFTDRTGAAQPIGGETAATLTINNIEPGVHDGHYWCEVSNDGGTTVSSMALLSFHPAPTITRYPGCTNALQPLCTNGEIDAIPGQNQQMSIEVSVDTVGETYQWQRCNSPADCTPFGADWSNINNNNVDPKILDFTAASNSDEGNYRCIVTNPSGTAASLPGILNVLDAATITSQPQDRFVTPNTPNITFSVTAAGQLPIFYYWERCPLGGNCSPTGTDWAQIDAGDYATANDPTLDLGNADISEVSYYRCKVNNSVSAAFDYSDRAIMSIADPGIYSQPTSLTVDPGQTSGFTVIAVGTGSLTYTWFRNGVAVNAGATGNGSSISFNVAGDQITISNTQNADEGEYRVQVANGSGTILSNPAVLTVNDPPVITQQPQGLTGQLGDTVGFQVVATSAFPLMYQWQKNGSNILDGGDISGANSDRLQITNLDDTDEATYSVLVSNSIGSVPSDGALLLVGNLLSITNCTGDGDVYQLSSRTLQVSTTGGKGNRTYQWQRNGVDIGTVITGLGDPFTASLPLNNITAANSGTYKCIINDDRSRSAGTPYESCALVISVVDHLSIPVITVNDQHVSSFDANEHDSVSFRAIVNGGKPPLTIEWLKEDGSKSNVVVAVGTSFQIQEASFADAATYQASVSDSGTDQHVSNTITLTVSPGVPVAGGLGLALLTVLAGAGGASVLRRRK